VCTSVGSLMVYWSWPAGCSMNKGRPGRSIHSSWRRP
jgi:hypothetical protein